MRWLDGITDMNLRKLQEMVEDSAAWRAAVYGVTKDDAVKVLHTIWQPIWKTQQRPQDWKRSIFIPIPNKSEVAQSCLTLCDPMDSSLPGFSVHGIFQARVLEWVAISFAGDLSDPGIKPRFPALQVDAFTL